MTPLTFRSAKIVDRTDDNSWSQVHAFSPDQASGQWPGSLLAVFSLHREPGQEYALVEYGRELMGRFHDEYYRRDGKDRGVCLVQALEEVRSELPEDLHFEVVMVVLCSTELILGCFGQGKVYLCRDGKMAQIGSGEGGEMAIFSGQVKRGDYCVAGTADFFGRIDVRRLPSLLRDPFDKAIEELTGLICGGKDGAAAGVVAEVIDEPANNRVERLRSSTSRTFRRWREKAWSWLRSSRRLRNRLTLSEGRVHRRRLLLAFLGFAVLAGVLVTLRFQPKEEPESELVARIQAGEAVLKTSPAEAREMVLQLQQAVADRGSPELRQEYERVLGVVWAEAVQVPAGFFDLAVIRADGNGESMVLGGEDLFVLDVSGEVMYRVETVTGHGEPISIDEMRQPLGLLAGEDRLFVVAADGVWAVGDALMTRVLEEDIQDDQLLAMFGGNMYLLDPASWEIYRYTGVDGEFRERTRWLLEVVKKADRPRDWAIDGRIWVLDEQGEVYRLSRGVPESFSLSSPREPLENVLDIALGENRLYLLDKNGTRLVIFDQDGSYLSQISWSEEYAASAMVADGDIAWLVGGSRIFRLELQ